MVWLPLPLKIFGNNVFICCPVCNVINFEINLSFFVKPFFYITKKSAQKCKYLKNERAFIEANKNNFPGSKSATLSNVRTQTLCLMNIS